MQMDGATQGPDPWPICPASPGAPRHSLRWSPVCCGLSLSASQSPTSMEAGQIVGAGGEEAGGAIYCSRHANTQTFLDGENTSQNLQQESLSS